MQDNNQDKQPIRPAITNPILREEIVSPTLPFPLTY